MNPRSPAELDRAAELREAFDRSFADPPVLDATQFEPLLDVRCGDAAYALRVRDIGGLVADVRVTPVSTPIRELMGIVGIRGAILPVYDLGALLGHAADPSPRWMAVAAGETPVGLAFSRLEGYLRLRADAIVAQGSSGATDHFVRHVVQLEAGMRPVVSIASVLDAIADRVRAVRGKE
jgi:chemotaxis signal transduction protein